ncbi:probable E3 ubiquitin-protein ligase RNF217 [Pecten maximus]|uniref:probable E3 ubiquitin-protein ligase RNF217 n=1 Tax=Pecten maximus TaxID=6579 RepID=UPI001457FDBC|nr:probable E3 ubiquitin-protein ligase RNF217 [Pecten maximus]
MFSSFWQLFGYSTFKYRRVSGNSISTLVLDKQPTSVLEVKSAVSKSLGIGADDVDVISNTTILENYQCDFSKDNLTEILVHTKYRRVPAGKRTNREDMFEGNMADGDRVKMSCKHAATPENLYRYCLSKLNSCDLRFKCMECSTTWELPEIATKADMSDDEYVFFSRKMTQVFIDQSNDIHQCPTCRVNCSRKDTKNKQVQCLVCKKEGRTVYSFCWECNVPWTKNHNCKIFFLTQEILDNCERITMEYSDIQNVPKVRACPKCELYIEHESGCKTMDCTSCHHTFCFSCLKPADENGVLQCGMYSSKCEVAPIQKLKRHE